MTSGYEAALLVLVLLLPGAFAAWGFERHVQRYGRRLKDWLLRLAGLSAVCLALGAGPLYWLMATYGRDFAEREALPWWLYLVPGLYLVLPASGGWALGLLVRRSGSPMSRLLGPIRAPSAWDLLFDTRESGFVSCRLRSGRWVGGLYADADSVRSYVGADGPVQDIYIAHAAEFDQDTGSPIWLDGGYLWTGGGILLKWADIESLEFRQTRELGTENADGEEAPLQA